MTSPRWKRRPHGSTWGDFGPDDERGRLNLITPEKVRQGVAEVREGLTFCLRLPLDYPGGNVLNPRRHPPVVRPTLRGTRPNFNFPACEEVPDATDVICDDLVVMHLQYSTQWDSLAHVGQLFDADGDGRPEAVYYNGFQRRRGRGRAERRRRGRRAAGAGRPDLVAGATARHATGWPRPACRAAG